MADPAQPQISQEQRWGRYIQAAAQGDQTAFASLYDESAPIVFTVALRILADRADAEEALVDVFSYAWQNLARYSADRGSPSAWLIMMARSRALDRLRSRASRAASEGPLLRDVPQAATGSLEQRDAVNKALNELPAEQRTLIELAFYSGMTQAELAHRFSIPLGTVKTRIRTAMLKLRNLLKEFQT